MNNTNHLSPCVCGNDKTFDKCCGRFLSGEKLAKTPEQVMRSRYTAFALGNYGQYLLDTWFPATAQGLNVQDLSNKTVDWTRLDVLSKQQKGDNATVIFNAFYRDAESDQIQVMHEESVFKRIQGKWLYVGGKVT